MALRRGRRRWAAVVPGLLVSAFALLGPAGAAEAKVAAPQARLVVAPPARPVAVSPAAASPVRLVAAPIGAGDGEGRVAFEVVPGTPTPGPPAPTHPPTTAPTRPAPSPGGGLPVTGGGPDVGPILWVGAALLLAGALLFAALVRPARRRRAGYDLGID